MGFRQKLYLSPEHHRTVGNKVSGTKSLNSTKKVPMDISELCQEKYGEYAKRDKRNTMEPWEM